MMTATYERSHPSGSSTLGDIVRTYRAEMGLSLRTLAAESGVHWSSIHKIETGQRGLGVEVLSKLSGVLGREFVAEVLAYVRDVDIDDDDTGV